MLVGLGLDGSRCGLVDDDAAKQPEAEERVLTISIRGTQCACARMRWYAKLNADDANNQDVGPNSSVKRMFKREV